MTKELSAGILFFTEDGKLFMGRVTGSSLAKGMPSRWDIPKGHVEEGETPIEAAIRECREETGFTDYDQGSLEDLGRHKYASNKDIHLFKYTKPVYHEQFKNCICTAYHTDESGYSFPEIDAFALIRPQQWLYVMGPSLYNVMQKLHFTPTLKEADWEC
jgi:8-oxo-dGTP pyrophosphatase MutT (NUDIX family)